MTNVKLFGSTKRAECLEQASVESLTSMASKVSFDATSQDVETKKEGSTFQGGIEFTELEEKIKTAADAYYQGNEQITDVEYDLLITKLKAEQPDSELLGKPIGSDIKGVTKKVKLPITMGTLDKCNTEEEMKTWWDKHSHTDILAELKIDGNGQCLVYKNGKLEQTISRGDGEYGEDTTVNIIKIPNIPHNLNTLFSGKIRGEVAMLRSTFNKYFPDGKNPRNQCAGIVKRLDGKDMDKLVFIAYDVFDDDGEVDKTEISKIGFLMSNGFQVPEWVVSPTLDDLISWKNSINPNDEIPCDGIVIKQNQVDKNDLARHTPMENVAFKPNLQSAMTTVKEIMWQLKGRKFAPVAITNPVELEGTSVSRASLANVNIMNSLGVYEGAEVIISKHGMIIPSVDFVVNPKKNSFTIPTICPVCGGEVKVSSSGIPECVNESCPRKTAHRFRKMFDVFGIKGAGNVFVSNLEDSGITIEDFLKMCKSNDEKIFNKYAGGINGQKIYKQMKDVMETQISAARFLATFDAPFFDEKRFLMFGEKTLDEFIDLSLKGRDTLLAYKGIADKIADAYLDFFQKNSDEISILRQYFTFKKCDKTENSGGEKMNLPTIVFTGTCPDFTRTELTQKCQGKYIVKDSVTKDLDYLACADPSAGTSKLQKAAKSGVKIISYTELLKSL